MTAALRDLLEGAVHAAHAGGEVLLERYHQQRTVGFKSSDTDLVTDADRASEERIAEVLRTRFPDHALLAEEGTRRAADGELRWVVDPLDGTVNYAHRIPHWCVSVALEDASGPLVGVVHDPLRGETFTAARGEGARLDGEPLAVTRVQTLHEGILATGFAYRQEDRVRNTALFDRFVLEGRGIRRMGSAALDLAWVACGRYAGFWELGLSRWDIAAGGLLVLEAGGRVTGFVEDEDWLGTGRIVAATPAVHPRMLALIADPAAP